MFSTIEDALARGVNTTKSLVEEDRRVLSPQEGAGEGRLGGALIGVATAMRLEAKEGTLPPESPFPSLASQ